MKQITHEINGQVYTLDFGKMAFSKFFGEATQVDPIVDLMEIAKDPQKQIQFITGILYGGINCHNLVTKQPLLSLETVTEWVLLMEEEQAADLINKFASTLTKKTEPGEVKAQLESPLVGTN